MHAVERADQLHACKIRAVQLRRHGLQLRAVEHAHHRGLHHVAEMVTERDLVAAEFLCLGVEMPAAHARAEVAGRFVGAVRHGEDVGLEDRDRDVQQRRIGFDLAAVDLVVAGIHHEKHRLKRHVAVAGEHLHQLCHQHRVLAARDADRDPVPGGDQLVALDCLDEGIPDRLAEFCLQTALDFLIGFERAFRFTHGFQTPYTGGQRPSQIQAARPPSSNG